MLFTTTLLAPLPTFWRDSRWKVKASRRFMEWVGRRVFERGYWKNDDEKSKEVEPLDASEGGEVTDGIIEDGDEEVPHPRVCPEGRLQRGGHGS
jgi:hypothetical protein